MIKIYHLKIHRHLIKTSVNKDKENEQGKKFDNPNTLNIALTSKVFSDFKLNLQNINN